MADLCGVLGSGAGARVLVLEKEFEVGGTLSATTTRRPSTTTSRRPPFRSVLRLRRSPTWGSLGWGCASSSPRWRLPSSLRTARARSWCARRPRAGRWSGRSPTNGRTHRGPAPLLPARRTGRCSRGRVGCRRPSLLDLAAMTPEQLAASVQDDRAGGLVRYLCAVSGFFAADGPLGLLGAWAVLQQLRPILVVGGSKSLALGLYRSSVAAGAESIDSWPTWSPSTRTQIGFG